MKPLTVFLKIIEIAEIVNSSIFGSNCSARHMRPLMTSRLSGFHSFLLILYRIEYFLPLNLRITPGVLWLIWTNRPGCKIFEFPLSKTCCIRETRFARMNFSKVFSFYLNKCRAGIYLNALLNALLTKASICCKINLKWL